MSTNKNSTPLWKSWFIF